MLEKIFKFIHNCILINRQTNILDTKKFNIYKYNRNNTKLFVIFLLFFVIINISIFLYLNKLDKNGFSTILTLNTSNNNYYINSNITENLAFLFSVDLVENKSSNLNDTIIHFVNQSNIKNFSDYQEINVSERIKFFYDQNVNQFLNYLVCILSIDLKVIHNESDIGKICSKEEHHFVSLQNFDKSTLLFFLCTYFCMIVIISILMFILKNKNNMLYIKIFKFYSIFLCMGLHFQFFSIRQTTNLFIFVYNNNYLLTMMHVGCMMIYFIYVDSDYIINSLAFAVNCMLIYFFDFKAHYADYVQGLYIFILIIPVSYLSYRAYCGEFIKFFYFENKKTELDNFKDLFKNLNMGIIRISSGGNIEYNPICRKLISGNFDFLTDEKFNNYLKFSLFEDYEHVNPDINSIIKTFFTCFSENNHFFSENKKENNINLKINEIKNITDIRNTNLNFIPTFDHSKNIKSTKMNFLTENKNTTDIPNLNSNENNSTSNNTLNSYSINPKLKKIKKIFFDILNMKKKFSTESFPGGPENITNTNNLFSNKNFYDDNNLTVNKSLEYEKEKNEEINNIFKELINDLIKHVNFSDFKLIGMKKSNKMLNIYIRYNKIIQTIEFLISDINSSAKYEKAIVKEKYTRIFLNKFSHEFRNPIVTLMQLVKNIKNSKSVLDQDSLVDLCHTQYSLKFLASLISDFNFISEYEVSKNSLKNPREIILQNKQTVYFQENIDINLEKLIKSCFKIIDSKIHLNEKNINLIYVIEKGVPSYFKSDYKKLKQILINLLSNSFKYTNHGFIKVNVEYKDANLYFKISDTGIGINLEKYEKDGEFGFISNSESQDTIKLGLFIVKKQVNSLGGNFVINKRKKIGTVAKFNITLSEIPSEYKINIIKSITRNDKNNFKIFTMSQESDKSKYESINTMNYMRIPYNIKKQFEFSTIVNKFSQTRALANNLIGITDNSNLVNKENFQTFIKSQEKNNILNKNLFSLKNDKIYQESNLASTVSPNDVKKKSFMLLKNSSKYYSDEIGANFPDQISSFNRIDSKFDLGKETLILKDYQFKFKYKRTDKLEDNNIVKSVIEKTERFEGELNQTVTSQANLIKDEITPRVNRTKTMNNKNNYNGLVSPHFKDSFSSEKLNRNENNSQNQIHNIKQNSYQKSNNTILNNGNSLLNMNCVGNKKNINNHNKKTNSNNIYHHNDSDSINETNRNNPNLNKLKETINVMNKSKFFQSSNSVSGELTENESNVDNEKLENNRKKPREFILHSFKDLDKFNYPGSDLINIPNNNPMKKDSNKLNLDTSENLPFRESLNRMKTNEKFKRNPNFIRILIVDDEKLIRKSTINVISKFLDENMKPYKIDESADGIEALYQIYCGLKSGYRYDYIFTDETMNFMNGSKMASIIRDFINMNIFYNMSIIMVTSYEISKMDQKIIDKFDKIITKPLSKNYLLNVFYI